MNIVGLLRSMSGIGSSGAALFTLLIRVGDTSAATITDNPHLGPPTSSTVVSGSGFGSNEPIDIFFDSIIVKSTAANRKGALGRVKVTIPGYAGPELHIIKAVGRSTSLAATAQFWVHTDWPQPRGNAGHTNANAYENLLDATSIQTATFLWSQAVPGSTGGGTPPIIANGRVYVAAGSKLSAFKTATGASQWSQTVGADLTAPAATGVPAAAGYVVFIGSEDGIAAFKEDGTPWWSKSPGGKGWTVAAIANDLVYVIQAGLKTPGQLLALRTSDGSLAWAKALNTGLTDLPAVANGTLYTIGTPASGNELTAYDASNGVEHWHITVTPTSTKNELSKLIATKDAAYVVARWTDGYNGEAGVYAFNPITGKRRWFYFASGSELNGILLNPDLYAVDRGIAYASMSALNHDTTQVIYELNAKTGTKSNTMMLGCSLDTLAANRMIYNASQCVWFGLGPFRINAVSDDGNYTGYRELFSAATGHIGMAVADGKVFYWNGDRLEVVGN